MATRERQPEATSTASDTLEYRPSVRPERSNRIAMTGRLTTDPVLRQTKSGIPVAHLRLATNDGKRSDFFDVVAWRELGEIMSRLTKGQQICLGGWLQTRSWRGADEITRYGVEIVAEEFHVGGVRTEA
jgi:single-strand DNA-binding protein